MKNVTKFWNAEDDDTPVAWEILAKDRIEKYLNIETKEERQMSRVARRTVGCVIA